MDRQVGQVQGMGGSAARVDCTRVLGCSWGAVGAEVARCRVALYSAMERAEAPPPEEPGRPKRPLLALAKGWGERRAGAAGRPKRPPPLLLLLLLPAK